MIILCIMWTLFRYLLHFAVTRRLEICRYISIRHDVKMCQKNMLQIVWSTLGRSLKLDPQPSNSSFYKNQLGFNTKVYKGTFCYKCLCPTPWEKNKSYGICVLYWPQGLAFCPGNFKAYSIMGGGLLIIIPESWLTLLLEGVLIQPEPYIYNIFVYIYITCSHTHIYIYIYI